MFKNPDVNICRFYVNFPFYILEWDQYDGVIIKEPEDKSFGRGIRDKLEKTWNKLFHPCRDKILKQTKMAVRAMLPSWSDLTKQQSSHMGRAERFLEKFDQVSFCVKKSFLKEDSTVDEQKIKEVIIPSLVFFVRVFIYTVISKYNKFCSREIVQILTCPHQPSISIR